VLRAWHDAGTDRGEELGPAGAAAVASRVGAGQLIDGSVVGTPARLTLSASLLAQPSGRVGARASVEGPADSLPALVDRLATQLLGQRAGLESERLSALTSTSLPAVREYLGGQAAYRRGHIEEALRRFGEALRIDSTFALAALEMASAAIWSKNDEARARGTRLALAGRARLGPADRALLEARTSGTGGIVTIRNLETVAAAYPDRPQALYELGDAVYHWGLLSGLASPLARAEQLFRRAWALDSSTTIDSLRPERAPGWAEPLAHMAELAHLAGDTAALRSLVTLAERADSGGQDAWTMRWHLASAQDDVGALDALWSRPGLDELSMATVFLFSQWSGLARGEAERSLEAMTRIGPGAARLFRGWSAKNGGRPDAAAGAPADPPDEPEALRIRIRDALYWDGDSARAARAVRRLAPRVDGRLADSATAAEGYLDLCIMGQWRLAQGDTRGADEDILRLRAARVSSGSPYARQTMPRFGGLCAAALEALLAAVRSRADAPRRLARFDSLARTDVTEVCCGFAVWGANLLIARLAERQGDLPHALAAVRRRAGGYMLAPMFLSTFLREEGRLAALTGDTTGAVRAYEHYLALRPDPEPRLRPQVDAVRAELARLVAER
jgi:tetratricopeptide (TPR) repeat protein